MKYVVFLQNAWSPHYAGRVWPRECWLEALWRCQSGRRLRSLLLGLMDQSWVDNVTPLCGERSQSLLPPDRAHVQAVLARLRPAVVVTCGKQAEQVLRAALAQPSKRRVPKLVCVPHPAARCLTTELYHCANQVLHADLTAIEAPLSLVFRQQPDGFTIECL